MESVMRLFFGYVVIAQSISALDQTQPLSRPGPAALRERLVVAEADHDALLLSAATDAHVSRVTMHFDRLGAGSDRRRVSGAEPE